VVTESSAVQAERRGDVYGKCTGRSREGDTTMRGLFRGKPMGAAHKGIEVQGAYGKNNDEAR